MTVTVAVAVAMTVAVAGAVAEGEEGEKARRRGGRAGAAEERKQAQVWCRAEMDDGCSRRYQCEYRIAAGDEAGSLTRAEMRRRRLCMHG